MCAVSKSVCSHSAGQELSVFMETGGSLPRSQKPPLGPTTSKFRPIYTSISCFSKSHFDNILAHTCSSPRDIKYTSYH